MSQATEKIAGFLVNNASGDIPETARGIAANAILDCIGVIIAGSDDPTIGILADQVMNMRAAPQAGVICRDFSTSPDLAAWVNGAASHVLDYDDTISLVSGYNMHPTVPVLAAVLAVGEQRHSSGRDIVEAYIMGLETEYRIGASTGAIISDMGWHPTPVLGTLGAAAACARLIKLTVEQTRMALGIACSMAGGLTRNFGTMTKCFHAGNAARNGVIAASLAERGYTASQALLEGEHGFCDIFTGGRVREPEIDDSTENWHIISTGITFKPYPCCRGTHPSIDAVLYLKDKHGIIPDQVASVRCKTRRQTHSILMYDSPANSLQAKFSMQYCISVALLRGRVTLEDFTTERFTDPAVSEMIPRVSYVHTEEWEKENSLTQEVSITLKDGREYTRRVDMPRGEPANPMTHREQEDKFHDCTRQHFSPAETERLLDMLRDLESLSDIKEFMKLLTLRSAAVNKS